MNSTATVHVTPNLDVTQAEYIHDLSEMAKSAMGDLYSRWYLLGSSAIEVVIRVGSLAFFTAILAMAAYLLVWRKDGRTDRDAVTFSLFSVIALWWMSQAASALAVVSNALQRYQRLGSDMVPIADQIDTVTECTLAVKDCTYVFHYYKPMYTYAMHQCVGTAALVTKVVVEALVCVFMLTAFKNGKLVKGCMLALLLATCFSAAVHAKHTCWPDPVPAESRIPPWNIAEEDVDVDRTTSSLFRTTVVLAVFLVVQRTWEIRHSIEVAYASGAAQASASSAPTARRRLLVYGILLGMGMMLALFRETFRTPVNLYEFALQAWTTGFVLPLFSVVPCLALAVHHLRKNTDVGSTKEDALPIGSTA